MINNTMENNLSQLIALSHKFGQDPTYVIAGGGNSSFKTDDKMWVKASGTSMANIDQDGFVCLDREKMKVVSQKKYSDNTASREQEVKEDLHQAILSTHGKRPSVEASMHEIIRYSFVMHTHPTLVNGVLCAKNAKPTIDKLFGDEVVYVRYIDPGYVLFKEVKIALEQYRAAKNKEAKVIFLENHGVFVAADTCEEIEAIYANIEAVLEKHVEKLPGVDSARVSADLTALGNEIRANAGSGEQFIIADNSEISLLYTDNVDGFKKVSIPFTPDNIVYCKSNYLFLNRTKDLSEKLDSFVEKHGYPPKIIALKGKGIVAVEESIKSAQIVMDVFKDMMMVSYLTRFFGGPNPMTQEQIDFIDNWEVENYRRKMSKSS